MKISKQKDNSDNTDNKIWGSRNNMKKWEREIQRIDRRTVRKKNGDRRA